MLESLGAVGAGRAGAWLARGCWPGQAIKRRAARRTGTGGGGVAGALRPLVPGFNDILAAFDESSMLESLQNELSGTGGAGAGRRAGPKMAVFGFGFGRVLVKWAEIT